MSNQKKVAKAKKQEAKPASNKPAEKKQTDIFAKPKETVEIIVKRKLLDEAPVEKHFIVSDGKKLKNVKELIDALETMNDEAFAYHANEYKNDFAAWLRDVFSHDHLAAEMERVRGRLEAQRVLMKKIIDEIEYVVTKKR